MYVIATIHPIPVSSTQPLVGLLPMPCAPKSENMYCPATCARLAITMMSAATMAQPPAQPVRGPNARDAQVNVVPQSGSALFSSLYPIEVSSIGMNASSAMTGAPSPTAATISPSAPDFSPLATYCSTTAGGVPSAVAMPHPSRRFYATVLAQESAKNESFSGHTTG